MHQKRLEHDCLESTFTEKDLRVLVGNKLNMNQQCVLVAGKASSIFDCITNRPRKVILPLNTGETYLEYWVKCWTPQYERDHRHGL